MILPIIQILILLPIILGILSVDINGNEFSIREWLDSIDPKLTENLDKELTPDIPSSEPVANTTNYILYPKGSEKAIVTLTELVVDSLLFISLQASDFGVWMGIATAPMHYALAVLVGISLFYPLGWVWAIAFVYVLINERKEIKWIVRSGIKEAGIRKSLGEIRVEFMDNVKGKITKIKSKIIRKK